MEKMFQSCCRNRVQREREECIETEREEYKETKGEERSFFVFGREMKPQNFFCNYLGRTLLL